MVCHVVTIAIAINFKTVYFILQIVNNYFVGYDNGDLTLHLTDGFHTIDAHTMMLECHVLELEAHTVAVQVILAIFRY